MSKTHSILLKQLPFLFAAVTAVGLSACQKNSSSSESGTTATTPQSYQTPGITFYSDSAYNNVDVEDTYYFGHRTAYLYYVGVMSNARHQEGSLECAELKTLGTAAPQAMAASTIGGYQNAWSKAEGRRYGRLQTSQGGVMGSLSSWQTRDGKPLNQLMAGTYLVCLKSRSHGVSEAMGFFFEVGPQTNGTLSLNLSVTDYRVHFSPVYQGRTFRSWHSDGSSGRDRRTDRPSRNLPDQKNRWAQTEVRPRR